MAAIQGCFGGTRAGPVRVIYAHRDIPTTESSRMLGKGIGTAAGPSAQKPASYPTMRGALGAPVVRIVIYHYPKSWGSFRVVAEYVNRLMDAPAQPFPYWAEGRGPEVFGTIEFTGGTKRPLELAKGYVFFQDIEGRSWWGRYLGPQDRWVVPRGLSPQRR